MIYFTSDLHFYHNNIIRYCNRPYASVEEMNEMLIKNWNDVVKPDDVVYCLGDVSLAARPIETFTCRLMGTKYLVPGNHDFIHSHHSKSTHAENHKKWMDFYTQHGWIVLPEQTTLLLPNGVTVNMCHLPSRLDKIDDKFGKYRPADDDGWLICGHVHDKWKQIGKMINVGVDVWNFKPVAVTEIEQIIWNHDHALNITQPKDS